MEAADVVTDFYADIYGAPRGFREHIEKQRAFVSEQDKLTDRAARLLGQMNGGGLTLRTLVFRLIDVQSIGRSFHRNGVYIPQPRFPNPRKRVPIAHPQPRKQIPVSHLRRYSGLINASDSDGEELVSEAYRDARLAYIISFRILGDSANPSCLGGPAHQPRYTSKTRSRCRVEMSQMTQT